MINEHRAEIDSKYARAYGIYFYVPKNSEGTEEKVRAENAWKKLNEETSFESLAKEISEEKESAENGGFVGLINKETVHSEVAKTLFSLNSGSFSKPVKTRWGYFILKREKPTEDDIILTLKDNYIEKEKAEILKKIKEQADIEKFFNTES